MTAGEFITQAVQGLGLLACLIIAVIIGIIIGRKQ